MSNTNATDTAPHFRTIFDMSPAELEVIKQDVAGYLNGLRAAHLGWGECPEPSKYHTVPPDKLIL